MIQRCENCSECIPDSSHAKHTNRWKFARCRKVWIQMSKDDECNSRVSKAIAREPKRQFCSILRTEDTCPDYEEKK